MRRRGRNAAHAFSDCVKRPGLRRIVERVGGAHDNIILIFGCSRPPYVRLTCHACGTIERLSPDIT